MQRVGKGWRCIRAAAIGFMLLAGPAWGKSTMVIAPHPDDEALTAAGIIQAAIARGETVKVVVVTNGDAYGVTSGYKREAESISALTYLGLASSSVIFLGYGDQALLPMYKSAPNVVYTSAAGQVSTYANQGLGGTDYHNYLYGAHGSYTRATLAGDIQAVIANFKPTDIYTLSAYDDHPDHQATSLLVSEALLNLKKQGYAPKLHTTLVHFGSNWPGGSFNPSQPFPKPVNLDSTPLEWGLIESIPVPPGMQSTSTATNVKYQAISRYASQASDFSYSFVRSNEFDWVKDYAANVAPDATATASSERLSYGQTAKKAIDGVVYGEPLLAGLEWASNGQLAGAWIRLTWPAAVTVTEIVLYDRPNLNDNVLGGTLTFSDGSSMAVGALPNTGAGLRIALPAPKTVGWVQFQVDSAVGSNAGLSEIEVIGSLAPGAPPTPSNVAGRAAVTVSSENAATGQLGIKAIDGVVDGYPGDYTKEWATVGQRAGAWIRLTWPGPMTVSEVFLYDRPNGVDNITAGTLLFSDGSSVAVGALPNNGAGIDVKFAARTVTWVQFRVDSAVGNNTGLAEMQVFGYAARGVFLAGVQCDPATVVSGASSTCTVSLTGAAGTGGVTVAVSDDIAALTVPASVTVPAGATLVAFTATAGKVNASKSGTVTATLAGVSVSAAVTVTPAATGVTVAGLQCNPGTVTPGASSTCTVTLSGAAGTGGAVVALASNNAAVTVPASVTVAAGATVAQFSATATAVASTQSATVTATLAGASATANITVVPVTVAGLQCNPGTMAPGASSTCTVTLSGAAGTGGAVVALASNNAAVTVPASATVAAGATAAQFSATAAAVASTQSATVTATLAGASATANITVTPVVSGSNIAPLAAVTVSSENVSTGQLGTKAVDGVIDGYPGDYTKEWATLGQRAGAWIRLTWANPVTLSSVVLYDRPNSADNVQAGTIAFSDGSTVAVGTLPNNGSPASYAFTARTVTWLEFRITSAVGSNIGLAEIQVLQ